MKFDWNWIHTVTFCSSMWAVVITIRIWWKIEDKIRSKKTEVIEI